jgi:hypothetical protein
VFTSLSLCLVLKKIRHILHISLLSALMPVSDSFHHQKGNRSHSIVSKNKIGVVLESMAGTHGSVLLMCILSLLFVLRSDAFHARNHSCILILNMPAGIVKKQHD